MGVNSLHVNESKTKLLGLHSPSIHSFFLPAILSFRSFSRCCLLSFLKIYDPLSANECTDCEQRRWEWSYWLKKKWKNQQGLEGGYNLLCLVFGSICKVDHIWLETIFREKRLFRKHRRVSSVTSYINIPISPSFSRSRLKL